MKTIFKTESLHGGDSLEITAHRDRFITVEIDSPWSGDTKAGFGRTLSINLNVEKVDLLSRALLAYLHSPAAS